MHHELKIIPPYFQDVIDGRKTFEIRKDDRGFEVGDTLILREWKDEAYTGRETAVTVTYKTAYGQMTGMVVLGIARSGQDDLAALQEEIERLKASRERLRVAFLAAMRCYHADSWERPETIREINDALEAACDALQDSDVADADPAPKECE